MSARPITDLIAEIWPKANPKADLSPLIALAEQQIREVKSDVATASRIVEVPGKELEVLLRDMPETVLDGQLDEICATRHGVDCTIGTPLRG